MTYFFSLKRLYGVSIPDNQENVESREKGYVLWREGVVRAQGRWLHFWAAWMREESWIHVISTTQAFRKKPYRRFYHIHFIKGDLLCVSCYTKNGKVGDFNLSIFSHGNLIQSSQGPVAYNFLPSIGGKGLQDVEMGNIYSFSESLNL